jgi:hypothetical protein
MAQASRGTAGSQRPAGQSVVVYLLFPGVACPVFPAAIEQLHRFRSSIGMGPGIAKRTEIIPSSL